MEMKTRMTDQWINQALQDAPMTQLPDGLIRTCIARLSFPNVFSPKAPMNQGEEPKYVATLLFPKQADLTVLSNAVMAHAQREFGDCFQNGQYVGGLHFPFRDQGEKAKYDGYVPGAYFVTLSSKYKPAVVDLQMAPILDESRVYPGVWAIATVNIFHYRQKVKRGVSVGLNSLMIVQDDEKLGGGGANPQKDFAGVNIQTTTNFSAAGMFGTSPATGGLPQQQPAGDPQAAARAALGL